VGGEVRGEGGEEGEGGKDRKALHTRMLYMSSLRCTFNEVVVKKDVSRAGKDDVGRGVDVKYLCYVNY